jgi:multiple RNA-binding domain-containing protein 1
LKATKIQVEFCADLGKFIANEIKAVNISSFDEQTQNSNFRIITNKMLFLLSGDPNKPQAWSKYAQDSTAYKKLNEPEGETIVEPKKEKKKEKKEKVKDPTKELLKKVYSRNVCIL